MTRIFHSTIPKTLHTREKRSLRLIQYLFTRCDRRLAKEDIFYAGRDV